MHTATAAGYRPEIAVGCACTTADLKNAAARTSRLLLLEEAPPGADQVAVFLAGILTRAAAASGATAPHPEQAPDSLTAGFLLDDLSHLIAHVPDDWEVWPWCPELHASHPGALITGHCPGAGDIAILVPDAA